MPTYDYRCESCDHDFIQIRSIADRDAPVDEPCPNCKESGHVRKRVTPIGGVNTDPIPKLNSDFKATMQKIRKANPRSTIPDY